MSKHEEFLRGLEVVTGMLSVQAGYFKFMDSSGGYCRNVVGALLCSAWASYFGSSDKGYSEIF